MYIRVLVRTKAFAIVIDPFCSCGKHRQFLVGKSLIGGHFTDPVTGHLALIDLIFRGQVDPECAKLLHGLLHDPEVFQPVDPEEIELANLVAQAHGNLFALKPVALIEYTVMEGEVVVELEDAGYQIGATSEGQSLEQGR